MDDTQPPSSALHETKSQPTTQRALVPPPPHIEQGFRTLYPVMPTPHIVAVVSASGTRPRTIHEPVSRTTIWRHLAPVGSNEHLALGIMPTEDVEEAGARTHFIVLDLDDDDVEPLQWLAQHLFDFGVPAYISRRTKGWGWQLVIFMAYSISGEAGALAVRFLAATVAKIAPWTRERLDVFPSAANGGMRILLPYRGASVDAFGVNPLMVATTMEAVPLTNANHVQRARLRDIDAALNVLGHLELDPFPWPEWTPPAEDLKLATLSGTDPRIENELRRIKRHYVHPHRQQLVWGFAGYMALHYVPYEAAVDHVLRLATDSGEPRSDIDLRLSAVETTYRRRDQGHTVAFRKYYDQAGVEPPSAVREPPLAIIDDVLNRAIAMQWQGNGGHTDIAVLVVLAHFMYVYGRQPSPATVEVAVACRALAVVTNSQASTVSKSLRRLAGFGLLEIESAVEDLGQALTYRFRAKEVPDPTTPIQSFAFQLESLGEPAGLKDCADIVGHAAFHQRALGPKAAFVALLLRALGPQSREDLEQRGPGNLATTADSLVADGIAGHEGGRFCLSPTWRRTCDDIAAAAGTPQLRTNKRRRIEEERAAFGKLSLKPATRPATKRLDL